MAEISRDTHIMPDLLEKVKPATLRLDEIKVGLRHRRDLGNVQALAASIADIGLLHPIVLRPDLTLISGERRLRAMESLGWTEVPVSIVEGLDDALRALKAETDENVWRKDFRPSECIAVADGLEPFERDKAKHRQRQSKGRGKRSVKLTDLFPGRAQDKVAEAIGMTRNTLKKARAIVLAAEDDPDKFGGLVEDMDRTGKVNGVYKRFKTIQAAEEIASKPPPLPDGPFDVITIDPPWQYGNRADDSSHRASNPYPSMSIDEIKAIDVAGRACEDCVLWMWTTNAHIPHAFDIVEGWGFTYKTMLTWVKDRMGTGDWLRGKTEHCLLAIRGKPVLALTNQTTAINGPLRKHSQKPEEFYQLIESLCPGSKLEMFSREKREGWASHGNEI
jgi:ParB/RepB/Spo0J family partition protein